MSQDKSRDIFIQIQNDFRSDLQNLKKMHEICVSKVGIAIPDEDTQKWILDVYINKLQELSAKMEKILAGLGMKEYTKNEFADSAVSVVVSLQDLAFETEQPKVASFHIPRISGYLNSSIKSAEQVFVSMRGLFWYTGWEGLSEVKPIEYVASERKKYVSAFDELQKAKDCLNGKVEDVTLHLRPAIDSALKEKLGFKKIYPMKQFLNDAEKYDLLLPSYGFIYDIYDEGSDRLHAGKPPTPWEAQTLIKNVSSFIDELNLIDISDDKIEEFKQKSRTVN